MEMLGYEDKEELLGISLQNEVYLRPEDRLAFQHMIESDGRVVSYPVDFKRKDGSSLPVLLTAHVRTDPAGQVAGYEGICVDQSQIVMLEQKVRETLDFLNNIIQNSPNAIIGADMKGKVIIWNQGAEETLGYKAREVIDIMDVRQLYHDNQAYRVMRNMRGSDFGGPGRLRSYPMTFRHQNGSLVEGNLSASIHLR